MEQTNDFQEQEQGVSPVEMPEPSANEMPEVEQPEMVPVTDLRKQQSVYDKQLAEARAREQAKDERLNYVEQALAKLEQERIANLDPDEKVEYEKEQYKTKAQRAEAELARRQLIDAAVELGLPREQAILARSPQELDYMLKQKDQAEKDALRKELEELRGQKDLDSRKASNVDVVVPMGGASPRKLSANELIAKGVEELINPRR